VLNEANYEVAIARVVPLSSTVPVSDCRVKVMNFSGEAAEELSLTAGQYHWLLDRGLRFLHDDLEF